MRENKRQEWYQIKEISKIINIPENTLRRYADLFSEFIISKKFSRSKKYSSESMRVFKNIVNLYNEGYATEEVREQLQKNNIQIIENHNQPNLSILPIQEETLSVFYEISNSLAEIKEELKAANDTKEEIELLKREIRELKENQNQSSKGFWGLFRRGSNQ